MTIRLFDKFNHNFTSGIYEDVREVVGGTIYFLDGDTITFDIQYVDWEEIDGDDYEPSPEDFREWQMAGCGIDYDAPWIK